MLETHYMSGSFVLQGGDHKQNAHSCSVLLGGSNGLSLLALTYSEVSGAALVFTTVTESRIRPLGFSQV